MFPAIILDFSAININGCEYDCLNPAPVRLAYSLLKYVPQWLGYAGLIAPILNSYFQLLSLRFHLEKQFQMFQLELPFQLAMASSDLKIIGLWVSLNGRLSSFLIFVALVESLQGEIGGKQSAR